MTEKKKAAPAKKAPAKKAPAKKAAPAKKPAAPKKPAKPKPVAEEVAQTPSGLAPMTGAVTPVTSNPSHEKTHVEVQTPVTPQKKKKSLLKRLFGR